MKWFREPRCSFRVRPVCRGILRLHQGCQVPFRTSRQNVGLGVAFQAPPGSQASSRGEAKDSALLSSRRAAGRSRSPRPEAGWRGSGLATLP